MKKTIQKETAEKSADQSSTGTKRLPVVSEPPENKTSQRRYNEMETRKEMKTGKPKPDRSPLSGWDEIADGEDLEMEYSEEALEEATRAWRDNLKLISWSYGNDDRVEVDPHDPSLVGQTVRLYQCCDQCSDSDSGPWEWAVETMLNAMPYHETVYAIHRGRMYEATLRSPLPEAMMEVLRGSYYNERESEYLEEGLL